MANTLRIKRRASGNVGAPSALENAELAFNEVDMTLYYGKGTGGAGGTATTIEAIGGSGAFVGLAGTQTITGNKTFSGTVALGSSATATTPAGSSNDTTVATTAFVKSLGLGSGSVTSVGLSLPAIFTVSNSPVTTSGTLTATLASQSANQVFVAPNGSSGAPTFRLLVAADIPTLTSIKISDFDTHSDNFPRMRNLVPIVDYGLHALVTDLEERSMLDDVSIIVWGEFGRTPRIGAKTGGRHHWPQVGPALMAGGGIRGGQTYGSSDRFGEYPANKPVTPGDVTRTVYQAMGIHDLQAVDSQNRPYNLLADGDVIADLF